MDGIGMGWLSYAIGLLNAPSVLITNVGQVPCTDTQPLTADVCYVRSTDVFRDSVNCIPCTYISSAQLAILRFCFPSIFSANPLLNSFQFLLRMCLPRVVSALG